MAQRLIPFTKMHGAGNDYVYLDCFQIPSPDRPDLLAVSMADRNRGIGGDGLILIEPSEVADARMRMFNADGSEAEMCGNGIRCVAKYVHEHGICDRPSIQIETGAGILALDLILKRGKVDSVRVDMGPPQLAAELIPTRLGDTPQSQVIAYPLEIEGESLNVTCVSMGNPHCVVFCDELTDRLVLGKGPLIENHPAFPARVNVEFVKVWSPTEVEQRTWERGSGETLACGTGASAVCVAGVLEGRTERRLTNHLRGGTLTLEWEDASNHVLMTGPATEVYSGQWPLETESD